MDELSQTPLCSSSPLNGQSSSLAQHTLTNRGLAPQSCFLLPFNLCPVCPWHVPPHLLFRHTAVPAGSTYLALIGPPIAPAFRPSSCSSFSSSCSACYRRRRPLLPPPSYGTYWTQTCHQYLPSLPTYSSVPYKSYSPKPGCHLLGARPGGTLRVAVFSCPPPPLFVPCRSLFGTQGELHVTLGPGRLRGTRLLPPINLSDTTSTSVFYVSFVLILAFTYAFPSYKPSLPPKVASLFRWFSGPWALPQRPPLSRPHIQLSRSLHGPSFLTPLPFFYHSPQSTSYLVAIACLQRSSAFLRGQGRARKEVTWLLALAVSRDHISYCMCHIHPRTYTSLPSFPHNLSCRVLVLSTEPPNCCSQYRLFDRSPTRGGYI